MDPNELVAIYSVTNPVKAEIIKNALEDEGIECAIGNETQAGFTGVLDIRILVRASDADRAKELIEENEAELAAEPETDEEDDVDEEE